MSTTRASVPSRRDEARALFRNAVLEAAEEVFAERGFHGARIADIAERARVAIGTVYNHFEQKEDVLRALLEERTEELLHQLTPSPSDPKDFEAKLTARIRRLLEFNDRHRGFFPIAAEHGLIGNRSQAGAIILGKPVRHMDRVRAAFHSLITEGVRSGALEDMDPVLLGRLFGGLMRSFIVGALEDKVPSLASHAPVLVGLFLRGAARRNTSLRA